MFRILIVCTGNVCRSPMAEGILRALLAQQGLEEETDVRSSGTWAAEGGAASWHGVRVASEHGVDIEHHRSRPLTRSLIQGADLILCMEPGHVEDILLQDPEAREKTHLLTTFADPEDGAAGGVEDPIGGDESAYRDTYKEIEGLLRQSLPAILEQIESTRNGEAP